MHETEWNRITQLLRLSGNGDRGAQSELYEQVYRDLHGVASRLLSRERPGHTLQPTALVNEGFLRLTAGATVDYQDRVHFFAVAARQMRRILVDHARQRQAEKRGGGERAMDVTLTMLQNPGDGPPGRLDLLDLDRALDELATLDERTARVVDLRFFAGLTEEEAALAIGVSPATIRADWRFAKGWLIDKLDGIQRG